MTFYIIGIDLFDAQIIVVKQIRISVLTAAKPINIGEVIWIYLF